MEHRWSSRRSIDCEVLVNMSGIGIVKARARNVSPEGMLLETGRITLRRGDVVDLDCIVPVAAGRGRIHRFRAQVVHARDGAAGLIRVDGSSDMAGLYYDLQADGGTSDPVFGADDRRVPRSHDHAEAAASTTSARWAGASRSRRKA